MGAPLPVYRLSTHEPSCVTLYVKATTAVSWLRQGSGGYALVSTLSRLHLGGENERLYALQHAVEEGGVLHAVRINNVGMRTVIKQMVAPNVASVTMRSEELGGPRNIRAAPVLLLHGRKIHTRCWLYFRVKKLPQARTGGAAAACHISGSARQG